VDLLHPAAERDPGVGVDADVDRLSDVHVPDRGLVDAGGDPDRGQVVGDGQLRAGGDEVALESRVDLLGVWLTRYSA
jgi:hypothetical protein